jgi:hypothetical protein
LTRLTALTRSAELRPKPRLKQEGAKGVDESGAIIKKNRWSKALRFVFENGKYQEK